MKPPSSLPPKKLDKNDFISNSLLFSFNVSSKESLKFLKVAVTPYANRETIPAVAKRGLNPAPAGKGPMKDPPIPNILCIATLPSNAFAAVVMKVVPSKRPPNANKISPIKLLIMFIALSFKSSFKKPNSSSSNLPSPVVIV